VTVTVVGNNNTTSWTLNGKWRYTWRQIIGTQHFRRMEVGSNMGHNTDLRKQYHVTE